MNRLAQDSLITCLAKGAERYIPIYDVPTLPDAMRAVGRWASDPELSFTWHNAAQICQKIREAATNEIGGGK